MSYDPFLVGPWRWLNEGALVQDTGERPAVIVPGDGEFRTPGEKGVLETLDPESPRAQLIAAAPELRDRLRQIVEHPDSNIPVKTLEEARDLLERLTDA